MAPKQDGRGGYRGKSGEGKPFADKSFSGKGRGYTPGGKAKPARPYQGGSGKPYGPRKEGDFGRGEGEDGFKDPRKGGYRGPDSKGRYQQRDQDTGYRGGAQSNHRFVRGTGHPAPQREERLREDRRGKDFAPRAPRLPMEAKAPAARPAAPRFNELTGEEMENRIYGRNPVKEALKAGRAIDKLYVQKDATGSAREILALARDKNLVIHEVDRAKLDQLSGGGVHQGFLAMIPAREYASVEDILARAKQTGEPPLVVVLDEIEDPHNLGSILRSALCSGAHGVIIPKRRSSGLTAIAVKASSGAAEHLPVAKVVNIQQTLEKLKKEGLWIAGADMEGTAYDQSDLNGPLALVIGAEGKGLGNLVAKTCDFTVSIPMKGEVGSLGASVAAGILLFEAARQRRTGV